MTSRSRDGLPTCAGGQGKPEITAVQVSEQILPFQGFTVGLSTAPEIFTKILRPVIQACREAGIRCWYT